jgi:hypothetical protein
MPATTPLAGATVSVFGLFTSTTDATGAFSIRFVPAGLGNISASAILISSPVLSGLSAAVAPVAAGNTNLGVIQLAGNSGTVTGIISDSQGHPVTGAQVSVSSGTMTLAATTDATGRYTVSNLLTGGVTVIAFDPVSSGRARATGTLAASPPLTLNLQLTASGSVSGIIFRSGGTIPAALVPVSLTSTGAPAFTTTDVFGRYNFDVVPAGAVTLDASDPATGDRGRATATLTVNATSVPLNVTLNGVGRAVVTVSIGGAALSGATVSLTSQTQFGGTQSGTTLADGTATFAQVLAGGVSVTATNPANGQTNSASSTVLVGATANIQITFQAGPGTGSISGRVLTPDGLTAVAGETVKLIDINNQAHQQTSGPDGSFRFDNNALGTYSLIAADGADRTQAHEVGIVIANGGDVITRNLTLVATGSVSGRVLNPDSSLALGISVALRSYNPIVGGSFSTTTNSDSSEKSVGEFWLGQFAK